MRTCAPIPLFSRLLLVACSVPILCLCAMPAAAATLAFTLTASEPVTVTGTPRIAIDVGGVTRYATYASGSGSAALTFSYAVQSGDFDANGITLVSPLELNGGSIADGAGNPVNPLTFTQPDTSALKVQTYTAAFTTSPITNSNSNAIGFTIAKAPTGASFSYAIISSGGSGSVTGSGTISGSTHTVSNVNASALPAGTLTLSVTVSTSTGGMGAARTATATPGFTGVLDSLPGAAAAFSTRRLASAYAGPLLRVRRSSDNAESDIATTVGGGLDAMTLASFCGAASCFVSALYDQSGNARDAVQITAASQPRIVNAGTLETEGGRAALRFAVFGQYLAAPAIPGQSIRGTFNAVARVTDTTSNKHVLGDRIGVAGRVIRAAAGGASYVGFNTGGSIVSMAGSTTQQRVVSIVSDVSAVSGSLDGTPTTGSASSSYQSSAVALWIGGTGGGASGGDWIGTISEATVFNVTLTTTQRQALERDQGSYYGIAVQ